MIVTSIDRAAVVGKPPNDWHCQLSSDRPIYDCPKCKESGMQFFAQRLDMPGREDFFYCRACGSTWEM
jgi:DNA-directed RNA polymerase subunit M/transcription elongation factor TFIIS